MAIFLRGDKPRPVIELSWSSGWSSKWENKISIVLRFKRKNRLKVLACITGTTSSNQEHFGCRILGRWILRLTRKKQVNLSFGSSRCFQLPRQTNSKNRSKKYINSRSGHRKINHKCHQHNLDLSYSPHLVKHHEENKFIIIPRHVLCFAIPQCTTSRKRRQN